MFINHLKEALVQIVGGRVCEICGRTLIGNQVAICTGCLAAVPRTNLHRSTPNLLSEFASNAVAPLLIAASWTFYDPASPAANLIRVGKYGNRALYLKALGRIYGSELMADIPTEIQKIDVILPVPMHPRKELKRGYNQAAEFAEGLSEVTGIVLGDNLLTTRQKDTQTHRNRTERRSNVKDIFAVQHPDELNGLNVMVVDDVITTGATISEAILAIGRSGARPASISILALAYRH